MLSGLVACEPVVLRANDLDIYTDGATHGEYVLRVAGPSNNWAGITVRETEVSTPGGEVTMTTVDGKRPDSAKLVTWTDMGQVYAQLDWVEAVDHSYYGERNGALAFRVRVDQPPFGEANLAIHCDYPCGAEIAIDADLNQLADGLWHDFRVPLRCFTDLGLSMELITTPFLLFSDGPMQLALEDIRWESLPNQAGGNCSSFAGPPAPLDQAQLDLFTDELGVGFRYATYEAAEPTLVDRDRGKALSVALSPGTNVSIQRAAAVDASAFNVAGAAIRFDFRLRAGTDIDAGADLLIKVATDWPNLSDVPLFEQVLDKAPAVDEWVEVVVPLDKLFSSQNSLSLGNAVDPTQVRDLLVLEPIGGEVVAELDNIRWTK